MRDRGPAAIDAALLHCAEVGLPDDADGTKTAAARREEVALKLAEEKRVAAVAALEAAADVEAIDAALLACTEAGVAEDHEAVVAATENARRSSRPTPRPPPRRPPRPRRRPRPRRPPSPRAPAAEDAAEPEGEERPPRRRRRPTRPRSRPSMARRPSRRRRGRRRRRRHGRELRRRGVRGER